MFVEGIVDVQDCIIQDCAEAIGIFVQPIGEVTVTGTTIRRCETGVHVHGKATVGKGCNVTGCTWSGVYAWKHDVGPGEVTVEEDAELVCEGDNTNNAPYHGDYVAVQGGTIAGVAEENIVRVGGE